MRKRPRFEASFSNSFASGIMVSMKTNTDAGRGFIKADYK
jgi:hypothetical protein